MATYTAPLRELAFVLRDVVDVGQLTRLAAFTDADWGTCETLLDEASRLITARLLPLRASGDAQGCRWQDGEVQLPDGYADAWRAYRDGGWIGLSKPAEWGGAGLPYVFAQAVDEVLNACNVAFALYPMLTSGCFEAIRASASDALKARYLPRLANGAWSGTMCLTEPQAGSDLAAIRTRAAPQADGSYRIDGAKIFFTAGEHGMADNIVHFVLARLPDAPPGVHGLSTFIVPKFVPDAQGQPGARNAVRCVSIEHKMGIHASCTCAMQFEAAQGWLAGAPHAGIQNMFVMMNLERVMVGVQGLGLCELATQNAFAYARSRHQGAAFNGGSTISNHPDVRRMLLTMKAITEGARVMAFDAALHLDIAAHATDADEREAARDWVDLATPLVKAFCTDSAFALGSLAMQVYGGHGYIRDNGIEQIVRDARILCLYEGTNGIQAMDLVRRKLRLHEGRLPRRFFAAVRADCGSAAPAFMVQPLLSALESLEEATRWLQEDADRDSAGFAATRYLRAFALAWLGWSWLRMARAAQPLADDVFRRDKLLTARFFAAQLLPEVGALCRALRQPAADWMQRDDAPAVSG
ncbi:MAG TPA: acyl-CoA dehydrogenase family protein [Nevskiaceae bacterium]